MVSDSGLGDHFAVQDLQSHHVGSQRETYKEDMNNNFPEVHGDPQCLMLFRSTFAQAHKRSWVPIKEKMKPERLTKTDAWP